VGFEWRNPATDIAVQSFEAKNNIILPDGYKNFLKSLMVR